MHVHIVMAHPEPASYNAALIQRAKQALEQCGHQVTTCDLHAQSFDPVERGEHYAARLDSQHFAPLAEQRHAWHAQAIPADVAEQLTALEQADLLILQFPLWWHGPPAILKGWFDRVFLSGGIYTSRRRYDSGNFRGRKALLSVTSGAPEQAFGPGARGGDPKVMLWPLHYSLHYLGFSVLEPNWVHGVQGHGYTYETHALLQARLERKLDAWSQRLQAIACETALPFPGWSDWDDDGQPLRKAADPDG